MPCHAIHRRLVGHIERSKDFPDLIAHIGRGRMLIENVEDRKYAVLPDEVKLPGGMPTISRTRELRIKLPSRKPGKPDVSATLKYTERAVELDALRTLVKQALQPSRPVSP